MPKLVFRYVLLSLLFFVSINSNAQTLKPKQEKVVMQTDSSKISAAKFDKEAINNYKDQKEFQYDEIQAQQLSLWDRFWLWFWSLINRLFVGAASNTISRYFFIGLGVALVLYIVVKIIGAENIFSKKSKEVILPYDVITENIHEIDYEQELQRLIKEKKYRLAVRLLYLHALKKLSDAEIIKWQPDKTNYNYLMEITRPELKNEFSRLTVQFDYIWYGDFPVDEAKFGAINQSFDQLNNQIK
ncbi:DUF4129 domain-containing protein [Pedobacter chinensis]|uniref:DUF4129 domain-containing protein n=2 Tax=Pedobacter chinensis TaxID=2282421 RepID=A0A369PTQ4_9SPHI|nr:DUF4129 domain-containing protein [Pedobacter chinensis]